MDLGVWHLHLVIVLGCEGVLISAIGVKNTTTIPGICNAYPTYATTEYVPEDVGCIGTIDRCGICNGNGSLCCIPNCTDPNASCVVSHMLTLIKRVETVLVTLVIQS